MIRQFDFIEPFDGMDVRLERIRGCRAVDDILKGKVNEPMPSGSSATEYTSWMRVCQDGVTLNGGMVPDTVRVFLFPATMH